MAAKNTLPRAYGMRALRLRLLRRREELAREVKAHMTAARGANGNGGPPEPGGGQSALIQSSELDLAQAARDATELAAIDTALTRIDLGECGLCAMCGETIPHARLEANPHALHCIACATTIEQEHA